MDLFDCAPFKLFNIKPLLRIPNFNYIHGELFFTIGGYYLLLKTQILFRNNLA